MLSRLTETYNNDLFLKLEIDFHVFFFNSQGNTEGEEWEEGPAFILKLLRKECFWHFSECCDSENKWCSSGSNPSLVTRNTLKRVMFFCFRRHDHLEGGRTVSDTITIWGNSNRRRWPQTDIVYCFFEHHHIDCDTYHCSCFLFHHV